MSSYYIKLKDNLSFTIEEAEKIRELELSSPELRFPEHLDFEVYGCFETKEECLAKIESMGIMKSFFEVYPQ